MEGEQIKTARREMVLAVVGTMKAGKSTTKPLWGRKFCLTVTAP
jgi:hypothetical protein